MIKYPWKCAPEWAKYAAVDADGAAFWYEEAPKWSEYLGAWCPVDGRYTTIYNLRVKPEESLRPRPESV